MWYLRAFTNGYKIKAAVLKLLRVIWQESLSALPCLKPMWCFFLYLETVFSEETAICDLNTTACTNVCLLPPLICLGTVGHDSWSTDRGKNIYQELYDVNLCNFLKMCKNKSTHLWLNPFVNTCSFLPIMKVWLTELFKLTKLMANNNGGRINLC